MVKNKASCGWTFDADGADGSPFLAGNGRSVLNRRFINLIIVVDDLPFGIADFSTGERSRVLPVPEQRCVHCPDHPLTNGQPFQAVIPIVRQESIWDSSPQLSGTVSYPCRWWVAHNGVVDILLTRNVDMAASLSAQYRQRKRSISRLSGNAAFRWKPAVSAGTAAAALHISNGHLTQLH